jgi:TP901 family phage tail tape measure protein
MAVARSIVVGIIGDNKKLKEALNDSKNQAKNFDKSMGKVFKVVGIAAAAVSAAIIGIGKASIDAATEMNKLMANVSTLVEGNIARTNELKKQVQDLAIEVGKGTTEMATGLYKVISAFGDSADVMQILEIGSKLAVAGVTDVKTALDALAAVTKGYGDTSLETMEKVADYLFTTGKLGDTTFEEFAKSVSRVVPLSSELKVSLEEMFTTFATGTGVTGNAAEVSTQFRGVLQSLLAPTDSMAKLMEELEVADGKAMIAKFGLIGSIEKIIEAADKSGMPLQQYIGSIEGQTLALALANTQNDTYKDKLKGMEGAQGSAQRAFEAQTQGINDTGFATQQLAVKWEVSKQRIGDIITKEINPFILSMMPVMDNLLTKVEETLPKIINYFHEVSDEVKLQTGETREEIDKLNSTIDGLSENYEDYATDLDDDSKTIVSAWVDLKKEWNELVADFKSGEGGLSATWNTIVTLIAGSIAQVTEIVTGISKVIRGIFTLDFPLIMEGLGQTLGAPFKQAWDGLLAIIKNFVPDIQLEVDILIQKIKAPFDKVVDWFKGIGRNIMNALGLGMKEEQPNLNNIAKEAGQGINSTMQNEMQIESPSKVWHLFGEMTAEGFIAGFENNFATGSENLLKLVAEFNQFEEDLAKQAREEAIKNASSHDEKLRLLRQYEIEDMRESYQKRIEVLKQHEQDLKKAQEAIAELSKIEINYYKESEDLYKDHLDEKKKLNQDYNSDMEKISKDGLDRIEANEKAYQDRVSQRTQELKNVGGFFQPVQKDKAITRDDIFSGMAGQLETLRTFEANLANLGARELPTEMLEELRALGPAAADNIAQIAGMSEADLTALVAMWEEKNELARRQAIKENEGFKQEIDELNKTIYDETQTALDARAEQWKQADMDLVYNYDLEVNKLANSTLNGIYKVIDVIKDKIPELKEAGAAIGKAILDGVDMSMAQSANSVTIGGMNVPSLDQNLGSDFDNVLTGAGTNIQNTYNITTPEALTEREIARQVNLSSQVLALEFA